MIHADPGLQQVLERMTTRKARQRYASCEQLIDELQLWIDTYKVSGTRQQTAIPQGIG